ncbi:hypothetical protein Tco_1253354 [Tanacetum coccineum]
MLQIQKRSSGKQNLCANREGKHKSINGKRFEQGEQVRLRTIVGMIKGNTSKKRPREQSEQWLDNEISSTSTPGCQLVDSPIILEALIEGFLVQRIYVEGGSSSEVMYEHCFRNLGAETRAKLKESITTLVGFSGISLKATPPITRNPSINVGGWKKRKDRPWKEGSPSPEYQYLIQRERPARARKKVKDRQKKKGNLRTPYNQHPTPNPPEKDTQTYEEIEGKDQQPERPVESKPREKVVIHIDYRDQIITIGGNLLAEYRFGLIEILRKHDDAFAWTPTDMTEIPCFIAEHELKTYPYIEPRVQRKQGIAPDRRKVVKEEVAEWLKAGIVRKVRYPAWVGNLVLVKKLDGSWRICIDFKDLNKACLKDLYPLSEID